MIERAISLSGVEPEPVLSPAPDDRPLSLFYGEVDVNRHRLIESQIGKKLRLWFLGENGIGEPENVTNVAMFASDRPSPRFSDDAYYGDERGVVVVRERLDQRHGFPERFDTGHLGFVYKGFVEFRTDDERSRWKS